MIANSILSAIRAAKAKNDYQTWGSLSIQAAQYIMPKLQAVAHISPNQAIETMEGLREFLIARDTKQLPPASDTAIEGEFHEVAPAPIESPSVNTGGQHSDVVEPFNGNSAPSPEPSKPFAELSRDEVIARYHPRA